MRFSFRIVLLFALLITARSNAAGGATTNDNLLILVSIDGFRWDYLKKYTPPNLSKLAADGVSCERLIPAFPSLTFPNHYTLVTGLWPEHHGIVANNMYDPQFDARFAIRNNGGPQDGRWWGGEPIWVTAIKQGRKANCMFWPGSEAEIKGIRPNVWLPFDLKTTPEECVTTVLEWLTQPPSTRPNFITLYFHQVDSAAHHDGLDTDKLQSAVTLVDNAIGKLLAGMHDLKLDNVANLVILSDHGMTELTSDHVLGIGNLVDTNKVQVEFSGAVTGLRPAETDVDAVYRDLTTKTNHFAVFRKEHLPTRYHFAENRRIPPIILVAEEGWYIGKRAGYSGEKAMHGYDPELPSMGATFIAHGPAFKHASKIAPVENVHVYNLMCATLGLAPAKNDGDNRFIKAALAK